MIEIEPAADTPELGAELREVLPLVDKLADEVLAPYFRQLVRVSEYFLALEIFVALGRMHPQIAREIRNRFPQAHEVVDPHVVAGYCADFEARGATDRKGR